MKGILAGGWQSKARNPKEAVMVYRNLQILKSYFFLSGNWNCLYHKHRHRLANLDKVGEFGKHQSKEGGTCYFY